MGRATSPGRCSSPGAGERLSSRGSPSAIARRASRSTVDRVHPPPTQPSNEAFAQSDNLRVGFLTVRTGPLAAGGRQMEEGINLLLKERNYAFAGRKVDIIFADTAGQPALAKTKTQELVEREKVHAIIGPLATFEALAIDEYMLSSKTPLITPTSAAQNDLAQRKQSDYVIHVYGT